MYGLAHPAMSVEQGVSDGVRSTWLRVLIAIVKIAIKAHKCQQELLTNQMTFEKPLIIKKPLIIITLYGTLIIPAPTPIL